MAATFVVETGSGSTTANSYLSVDDADQYFENYGNTSTWTALDAADKEQALRFGTQFLETRFAAQWLGRKANKTQALAWPRCGIHVDGYLLDDASLPQKLKDATAEAALRYLTDGELFPDVDNPGSVQREKVAADGAEVETAYFEPGQSQIAFYRKVELLVREFVYSGSEVIRG